MICSLLQALAVRERCPEGQGAFAVASPGRLKYGIEAGLLPVYNRKIYIDSCLDKLCGHHPHNSVAWILQGFLQAAELLPDMRRTHHFRQMYRYAVLRETGEQLVRIAPGVDNTQHAGMLQEASGQRVISGGFCVKTDLRPAQMVVKLKRIRDDLGDTAYSVKNRSTRYSPVFTS